MRATLIFEYTVDGIVSSKKISDAFLSLAEASVITSESVDGTDDWAILLESVEVRLSRGRKNDG